ncbi:MAG: 16S rRNA (uracil(1498)-N(3))-methyltransferase [Planctomycetes bacterium]|nr:16S rRNA (uracil(1498)-N(3))-methyltransferase [Planctomycetota bacterium]
MARRYHLTPLPPPGRHPLPAELSHHLARVMRIRVGGPVVLFDGAGLECAAAVCGIRGSGRSPTVEVETALATPGGFEPDVHLTVAFPPPKGGRTAELLEHGTELGIAAFQPLRSARAVRDLERPERWQRVVAAAAGQCDRARIPALRPSCALRTLLEDPALPAERYLADAAGPPLAPAQTCEVVLLVGPEGGLSEDERSLVCEAGFAPRRMAIPTLRVETAVLAGAALLLSACNRLGNPDRP